MTALVLFQSLLGYFTVSLKLWPQVVTAHLLGGFATTTLLFLTYLKLKEINFGNINYLFDETQEIAKKYGAVCTPDFFGYNKNLELQYRGRFRELKDLKPINNGDSDLKIAMQMIAKNQKGPAKQISSMGCNIKWR